MKTLIFDFDGTLADSMAHVKEMADEILPAIGVPKITEKQIEEMRKMTIAQGFRYLKVPFYKLPSIVVQGKQMVAKRLDKIEPIEGIIDTLEKLRALDVSMGILTSNSAQNVETFLERHKMREYFDFVQAGAGVFTKNRKLKLIVKHRKLKLSDCVYLGDEIRDVEAAQAIKMPVIAVGWGINHPDTLKDHNPSFFAAKPLDIVTYIKSNS